MNPRLVGLIVIAWAGGVPSILWDDAGLVDSVTDNGVGDVTLNLNARSAMDGSGVAASDETVFSILPRGATPAMVTVTHTSDTAKQIRVFDAAGAALDNIALEVTVHKRVRN